MPQGQQHHRPRSRWPPLSKLPLRSKPQLAARATTPLMSSRWTLRARSKSCSSPRRSAQSRPRPSPKRRPNLSPARSRRRKRKVGASTRSAVFAGRQRSGHDRNGHHRFDSSPAASQEEAPGSGPPPSPTQGSPGSRGRTRTGGNPQQISSPPPGQAGQPGNRQAAPFFWTRLNMEKPSHL